MQKGITCHGQVCMRFDPLFGVVVPDDWVLAGMVNVTVAEPVPLAVSATELGLAEQVAGDMAQVRVTVPAKPPVDVKVTLKVPEAS